MRRARVLQEERVGHRSDPDQGVQEVTQWQCHRLGRETNRGCDSREDVVAGKEQVSGLICKDVVSTSVAGGGHCCKASAPGLEYLIVMQPGVGKLPLRRIEGIGASELGPTPS